MSRNFDGIFLRKSGSNPDKVPQDVIGLPRNSERHGGACRRLDPAPVTAWGACLARMEWPVIACAPRAQFGSKIPSLHTEAPRPRVPPGTVSRRRDQPACPTCQHGPPASAAASPRARSSRLLVNRVSAPGSATRGDDQRSGLAHFVAWSARATRTQAWSEMPWSSRS
jgi:hypothetical protein